MNRIFVCDNCSTVYAEEEDFIPFDEIKDVLQRLTPGGKVPDGECRKCRALVFRAELDPEAVQKRIMQYAGYNEEDTSILDVETAEVNVTTERVFCNVRLSMKLQQALGCEKKEID